MQFFSDQHRCAKLPVTSVLEQPRAESTCTSEVLYGESLRVLSEQGEWCRVRLLRDGYEGFVSSDHLTPVGNPLAPTTHSVWHRSTLLFAEPDIKSQLRHRIPFGSELALTVETGTAFSRTSEGHYVWSAHCLSLAEAVPLSMLQLASQVFLGTPYLWGGRSPNGIDCSGLTQALARSQGIPIPRDSGDQEAFLTQDVTEDDYQSQDFVYWPGHTGILVSSTDILHATAHSLSCVIEPLQSVVERAGPVRAVKRLLKHG